MGTVAAEEHETPVRLGWASTLTRFEWTCLGVVALAFLARIPFLLTPEVIWDSAWYLLLARQFGEHGSFYLPWSEPGAPQYNGYWPPLYPIFLAPVVKVLGASYASLIAGAMLATALLCATVFATTRDLYGRTPALAATALIAANPAFLVTDSAGMSESLLATMVTATVWAFLKSLERAKWLPVAAFFASLAYLGKASLGLPLVGAGLAAIIGWRVWTRGLRATLRSPSDMLVFGLGAIALVALALTRTSRIGGVGLGLIEPLRLGVLVPTFPLVYAFKLFFATAFLLVATLPFSLRIREAWNAPRSERKGALLLASGIPLVLGAVFTSTFYHTEGRPLVDFDNIRYLTPAIVPFLWLVLPHNDLSSRASTPADAAGRELARRHWGFYGAAVGTMALVFLLNPMAAAATITRLNVFLALALIPLALGAAALATQYDISTRRLRDGTLQHRYVLEKAASGSASFLVGLGALAFVLAWYVSAWFAYVAVALAVASTTRSPRARAVTFVVLLLCATAPTMRTDLPVDDVAAQVAQLPPGTVLAMADPLVYFAAVAPDHVQLVLYEGDIPDHATALIVQADVAEVPGWRLVSAHDYGLTPYPTVAIEQRIEKALTGSTPIMPEIRAFTLFVRESAS